MWHFHWGQLFITLLVQQTLMNHLLVFTIRWGLPTPNSFPVVTVLNIVKLVYNHMMIKTRFKSGIGPLISLCICNGWWNVANHAERRAFQFWILQKIYTSNSDSNLLLWEKPTLNFQLKHIMLSLLFCFNFIFAIFIITTFILYLCNINLLMMHTLYSVHF